MPAPIDAFPGDSAEGSNRDTEEDLERLQSSTTQFMMRSSKLHSSQSFLSRKADKSKKSLPPALAQDSASGEGMVSRRNSEQGSNFSTTPNQKSVVNSFKIKSGPNTPRADLKTTVSRRDSVQKMTSALRKVKTLAAMGSVEDQASFFIRQNKSEEDAVTAMMVSVIKAGNSKIMKLFNAQELRQIVATSAARRLTRGQLLMSQGEFSSSMFIVISGGLDVLVDFSGRNKFAAAEVVDQVGQGAALGEIGMMTGERRTAFLKATEECHLVEVTYTAVKEVTLRRTELNEELMMIVKEEKRELLKKRRQIKENAEKDLLFRVDKEVDKVAASRVKAKQVKVQAWQNRIGRVVNTQKQVDIHNNVESMRLQIEEGLKTSFLVAWSLVELKNDSDQRTHNNLVELLVEHPGVTQMAHRQRGLTILQKAAMLGAVRLCASILKCGADVDKVDSLGKAALHYAVEGANHRGPGKGLMTVRILLAAGAQIFRTLAGETAIDVCNRDDIRLLLHNDFYDVQMSRCCMNGCGVKQPSVVCDRCKLVKYCCMEHMNQNWGEHKKECRAPAAKPDARMDMISGDFDRLASDGAETPGGKYRDDLELSEAARASIEKAHDRINDKVLGRNWQVYDRGVKMEKMHHEWVLRDWISRWLRFMWTERVHLAIGYRDEMKNFPKVGQESPTQGGPTKLPNTGARQASTAVDKSSPETLEKSPSGIKEAERYTSGGWDELAALSARAQQSRVAHPAKWGAARVAKQDSVWTENSTVPLKENSSDGGPATSRGIASGNAAMHSKPTSLSPKKPGGSARGPGPSPRTNALRTAAAASSGEVGGVVGAARESLFAQISRCMSDSHTVLAGQSGEEATAAGKSLGHEQGGDADGEVAQQNQKKRRARKSLRAAKFALSMGRMASSRSSAKPAASQLGVPSSKGSKGMGLWDGVLGRGQEEEEPSRLMEGYTSKLKAKVNIMSEASYLIDKKYQRRRSSISSTRRGSLISNASDDKPVDKRSMASVVLDHIQHLDEEAKAIVLEKVGMTAGGDQDEDVAVVAAMSKAEFEDYLLQLDRVREMEPSKEDSVEKLIGSIKSGEMDVEDLTLDQMKLICDIGWDMGQRARREHPRRNRVGRGFSFASSAKLKFASHQTLQVIRKAALEHKIDPLGSPLHPDHHHDSSTGSVKRFKNVVFHSFRDKNRRGGIEAGHDSD